MDPICHTLAGAIIGEAGLKNKTALGMSTLVVAANIPDIDVLVYATDTLAVSFRRGWTHGPLALVLLPLLLATAMLGWDRLVRQRGQRPPPAASFPGLLLLAVIGTLSHPLLDFMNSYGIRLLMPFSGQWFYGDALYIVDPWLYLLFGVGVVWARRTRDARRGPGRARVALALASLYIALMFGSNLWARREVASQLARAGQGNARFMVTPVPVNPFRREVIVDTGTRYEKGLLWFSPGPHFRPAGFGVEKGLRAPEANYAMLSREAQQFLVWSRFPFFVVDRSGSRTEVFLNDFRYSSPTGRDGWATTIIPGLDVGR